jgi:hypothetical protein
VKLDDPMLALLYHQYREGHRQHPTPHSPPVTAVLALLGIVVMSIALAAGFAIFVTFCSIVTS